MDISQLSEQYAAGIRDFSGINLAEINLTGINLKGVNLSGAKLSVSNLSEANLSKANLNFARLNVARLSGAILEEAKLNYALLNVANLIRANLKKADLTEARLVKVELVRANLSGANLKAADLNGSDLRETVFIEANLSFCDLRNTNMRSSILDHATFFKANLRGANLSQARLEGANLQEAELVQTNLSNANLNQADLRNADLRGADLTGASLRGADLRNANLIGAKLIKADLKYANLSDANLTTADLSQSNLIKAEWLGVDLTRAILTGAKIYGISRFGIKTKNIICDWVDLSSEGDRSKIYDLKADTIDKFFNETAPKIKINVEAALNLKSNLVLATVYEKITKSYPIIKQPPSIEVKSHRTILTFQLENNDQIFSAAYLAIFPFGDRQVTHRHLVQLLKSLKANQFKQLNLIDRQRMQELKITLNDTISRLAPIKPLPLESFPIETARFFQAPTQTILINSQDQSLEIYHHPNFGRHLVSNSELLSHNSEETEAIAKIKLPSLKTLIEFIIADIAIGDE
jgi:uncharacterized protein YjbI with pentapeptide repeats